MQRIIYLLRTAGFTAGIAVALGFGISTALSGTNPPCTELPPHTCPIPDDCDELCQANSYAGGTCNTAEDCCVCFE